MIRLILFILLLGVPIAEIAVFIAVGSAIGVLPTILLIILTTVIGATLLRRQGVSALAKLQDDVRNKRTPAGAIGEAVTVAIAGILLLTPGFITDAVGFTLFIPAVRRWLWRGVKGSIKVVPGEEMGGAGRGARRGDARTIDLDEGDYSRSDGASPWQDRPNG